MIFYLWIGASAFLVGFYLYFHWRLIVFKPKVKLGFHKPVSIIVCAHNEEFNLRENLEKLLTQDYFEYEVLVVNDESTDGSETYLGELKSQFSNLNVINHKKQQNQTGKKHALKAGIAVAKYEYFLMTDADCRPVSENWLSSMARHFSNSNLVLGYSPLIGEPSFVQKLYVWETLLTGQHYLSFAIHGKAYMGVGRNLAYTKSLFNNSDKFESHLKLASGDDDLFVSQVVSEAKIAVELSANSQTVSNGPSSFWEWWKQKRRHLSTSSYYKPEIKRLLGLFGLSQLLFYSLFFLLMIGFVNGNSLEFINAVIVASILKFTIQYIGIFSFKKLTGSQDKMMLFPIWEFLVVVFLAIIHVQIKWGAKQNKWS